MSDTDSQKPEASHDPGISRRDFLRRAGKEAAYTGTKLVPGAAIAQKVLGISDPELKPATDDPGKPAPNGIVERFASWRRQRREADGSAPK